MTADDTRLRPVTTGDLDLFAREFATGEGTGPHQWLGFSPDLAVRRRFAEEGLLGPQGGVLTVTAKGEAVGRVEWFSATWGRRDTSSCGPSPSAWSARGFGHGTRAQQLLAAYLFDHTRAHRLQAWTDVANLAEHQALEKTGFQREGVLRGAQWRDGAWPSPWRVPAHWQRRRRKVAVVRAEIRCNVLQRHARTGGSSRSTSPSPGSPCWS